MFQSTFTLQFGTLGAPAGTEQTFAQWGFSSELQLDKPTSAAKKFTLYMVRADPLLAPPVAFEQLVVIRQYNSAGAVVFTFQGRRIKEQDRAHVAGRGIHLTFADRFYDLEKTPYKQQWLQGNVPLQISRAFLFQDPNAPALNFHMSFATQVADIILWAASTGMDIQAGIIDNTQVMPWYAVRGLSCLQALETCQKFFPNMRMWIDDTTTPPTFNCRFQANLATTQMQWAGQDAAGRLHISSDISPLEELTATAVQLHYQAMVSINGVSAPSWDIVTYPVGNAGNGLRTIVVPIDLRGFTETDKTGPVVAVNFDPTILDFWAGNIVTGQIGKIPALGQGNISGLAFTKDGNGNPIAPVITDANGNPVNLATYPNEWKSGSIFSWMSSGGVAVNLIEAKVIVHLTYARTAAIGASANTFLEKAPTDHVHTVNVKLTNSAVGTTYYSALTSFNSGESPVAGVEQAIYNDRAILQHEGTHLVRDTNAYTAPIIGPENTLTLLGGRADWAAMGIASVQVNFFADPIGGTATRKTTITLGPAKHLSPQDFNQYVQLFRGKVTIDNPSQRLTGAPGASLDIGGNQAKQDSQPAAPQNGYETFSAPDATTPANINVLVHDPANQVSRFTQYVPAGTVNTAITLPRIFSAQGAPGAGTLIAGIQYQAGTDIYFDATVPASPVMYLCTAGGTNATSVWAKVTGGGSGGWNWRGAWTNTGTYNTNDVVMLGSGTSAGMYLCLTLANANSPDSGIGWVQISSSAGTWL